MREAKNEDSERKGCPQLPVAEYEEDDIDWEPPDDFYPETGLKEASHIPVKERQAEKTAKRK
jgi:hypothetical protein